MSLEEKLEDSKSQIEGLIFAKVGGRFLRFSTAESVPETVDEGPYTIEILRELTPAKIGELYGNVAKVPTKNFKDPKVAIDSLVYQVAKIPLFDPNKPVEVQAATPIMTGQSTEKRVVSKKSEFYELSSPADLDKVLGGLAPQARELVLIMTELANDKGSTKFSSSELEERINLPEVAARLKTKQEPLRILKYYKGKLIGSGLIKTS